MANRTALMPCLLLMACATAAAPATNPLPAQDEPAPALQVAPLAGSRIPVLPVTFMVVEEPVDTLLPADRTARHRWVDSVLTETLFFRGPEVTWVLPPELRRAAQRAPNMVTNPDRMGQALLRSSEIEQVPDPLRGYLRGLTAMTNSRLVLVPAAVRLSPDSSGTGIRAEVVLVLADSRSGNILWRSTPVAIGRTPAAALEATINHILQL